MSETQRWQAIPTQLDLVEFEQFVLPHLSPPVSDKLPPK